MNKYQRERRWSVYYELYIDVLFLVNFMMDYLLLLIVRKILKCSATHVDILLGSLAGSLLTCAVIVLPIESMFVKMILFHTVINSVMIRTGLKIKKGREFLRAFVALYIGGFLLGGVFTYLHQYVRAGSLFFAIAVTSYYLVQGIWTFITCMQRITMYKCNVTLYMGGTEHTVKAIIDTGNSLRDPLTNLPVCVVEEEAMKDLVDREQIEKLRCILFHSIGKENGRIPVIELEKMCIHNEKECWVEHPMVGICGERISADGDYGMILNPDIFR